MKRILLLAFLISFGVIFKTQALVSDDVIISKCPLIKTQIDKVSKNDLLTRVNYGQMYESIIRDVMTPTNTRVVANRLLNSAELVAISNQFEDDVNVFRNKYQIYELKINSLNNFNCQKNPTEFYQLLTKVRLLRLDLAKIISDLENTYHNYGQKFKEISNA